MRRSKGLCSFSMTVVQDTHVPRLTKAAAVLLMGPASGKSNVALSLQQLFPQSRQMARLDVHMLRRVPRLPSLSLPLSRSVYLSINLAVYLSIHPSIHPSIYLSIHLSLYLSLCLSPALSASRSLSLSIYPSL